MDMKLKLSIFSGAIALALLAGCGGGGGAGESAAIPPQPSQPTTDSFTQSVQAIVAMPSETAAPVDITGFAAVTSESSYPIFIY
jgi:hypothetical protein